MFLVADDLGRENANVQNLTEPKKRDQLKEEEIDMRVMKERIERK